MTRADATSESSTASPEVSAREATEISRHPTLGAGQRARDRRRLVAGLSHLLGRRTIVWLLVAIVASLALALVELGISLFLQLFLASLRLLSSDLQMPLGENFKPSAAVLALGLVVIAFLRSLCQFLVGQSGCVSMETINARIRRLAIWEMLLHPSKRVVPAAAVNARVGDLAVKSSMFCYNGAFLVGYVVQGLGLAVVMLATGVGATFLALVGLGVVGVLVLWANKAARKITASVPSDLRVVTEGIERVARNVPPCTNSAHPTPRAASTLDGRR